MCCGHTLEHSAAVRTAAGHMKRPDNMKHLLFKRIGSRLILYAGSRIVKYAFLTGTSRTYITAGVTANAPGQLSLPERKSLIRGHRLDPFYLIKTAVIRNLSVLTQKLIIRHVPSRLTVQAAVRQQIFPFHLQTSII